MHLLQRKHDEQHIEQNQYDIGRGHWSFMMFYTKIARRHWNRVQAGLSNR
jgi:hypothetical protein